MATTALRAEERIGLSAAIALHAALAALFLLHRTAQPPPAVPERIAVTISEDVAPTSTSPEPAARAAPDVAPQLGEPQPAPPQVAEVSAPLPTPPAPAPPPAPPPVPRPAPPAPTPKVAPAPAPAPPPSPSPAAARPERAKPAQPSRRSPAKPFATRAEPAVPRRDTPAGRSRVGEDFLKGVPAASEAGDSPAPPAAAIGPAVRASLASSISRQLKPYWAAPQGADAELLVTVLAFDLNANGSLDGSPRVVRQSGITDANRAQADRHAEQAVRAVELAAPFDLPAEYFDAWKRISSFRFDKRLSQ